jgi:hypothetical protein
MMLFIFILQTYETSNCHLLIDFPALTLKVLKKFCEAVIPVKKYISFIISP